MARPEHGPAAKVVRAFEHALGFPLPAAVSGQKVSKRILVLRKRSAGRVVYEVGRDKNDVVRSRCKELEILARVISRESDAVNRQIPSAGNSADGPGEVLIMPIRPDCRYALWYRLVAASHNSDRMTGVTGPARKSTAGPARTRPSSSAAQS